jgi:hypothetical protein
MKKAILVGLGACVFGVNVACGPAPVPRSLVMETGCVSGTNNEFILTDLEDSGRPVTDAYLLVGAAEKLKAQVGRRVRVAGEADPAKVVDIRILQPTVRVRPASDVVPAMNTLAPQ